MNLFRYKGYYGDAVCDTRDHTLHGKIQFIRDTVTYEAQTPAELEREFRAAVDDYLETCESIGKAPEKPFKGSFNVRIDPELHRMAAVRALMARCSLNEWVQGAIQKRLGETAPWEFMIPEMGFRLHTAARETATTYRTAQDEGCTAYPEPNTREILEFSDAA